MLEHPDLPSPPSPYDARIAQQLASLEEAGLIRRAAQDAGPDYLFHHALVHHAVYESLLRTDRRALHRLVGEILEALYQDQLPPHELAPLLAEHFAQAGEQTRALQYRIQAADAAAERYANQEAIRHYSAAIEEARALLASEPGSAQNVAVRPSLKSLYLKRGRLLEISGRYEEALAGYEEMAQFAQAQKDTALEVGSLLARATVYATFTTVHDATAGQALAEQAQRLAQSLGDAAGEAMSLWILMLVSGSRRTYAEAIGYGEQALALAEAAELPEQLAQVMNDMTFNHLALGQLEEAQRHLERAEPIWRTLANGSMLAENLTRQAVIHHLHGEHQAAARLAEEAYQINLQIGSFWGQAFSVIWRAATLLARGYLGEAIEGLQEALRLSHLGGFASAPFYICIQLTGAYIELGQPGRAYDLIREVSGQRELARLDNPLLLMLVLTLKVHEEQTEEAEQLLGIIRSMEPSPESQQYAILLRQAETELRLKQGRYEETIELAQRTQARMKRAGITYMLPQLLYLEAQGLRATGQLAEARARLSEASDLAATMEARPMLWPILVALGNLESQLGNPQAAQQRHHEAGALLAFIVEHCPA
ncbi:MAG: hypothetical protein H0T73_02100, partial [Ardenticatenales bacterium]|nr:hypothetical protein [Ardenticatenales bacterium]